MTAKVKPDWAAVRLAYINSSKSIRQLAEEFKVGASAAMKRCASEGWEAKRKQQTQKVSIEAEKVSTVARAQELAKFNEADLKVACAIREKAALMLQETENPMHLRALAAAMDSAQKIGRLALGATTENAGHSGPNGGPIPVTAVPVDDYLRARQAILNDF
jgi:hypothetical protein